MISEHKDRQRRGVLLIVRTIYCSYLRIWRNNNNSIELQSNSKQAYVEVDLANLPIDHCLRKKSYEYHINDKDQIRRTHLQKKKKIPFQPVKHDFSNTKF